MTRVDLGSRVFNEKRKKPLTSTTTTTINKKKKKRKKKTRTKTNMMITMGLVVAGMKCQ